MKLAPIPKTWEYITTEEGVARATKFLKKYLGQSLPHGVDEPIFGVDVETFRPDGDRTKFPNAFWNGEEWEGRMRLLQIGTDPDLEFGNRQFVFDVVDLGEELLSSYLKEPMESVPWLCQGGMYEYEYITAQMDIHPKLIIDTKLISQVYFAGDRINHDLGDVYENFMRRRAPGLFDEEAGASFFRYKKFKKMMQKSRWDAEVLSSKQIRYAADDSRLPFHLYNCQLEAIEEWTKKYERGFKDNEGMRAVMSLEFNILPMFAKMEQEGIQFDVDYYTEHVIPLMERKRDEAYKECARYKELVWREKKDGVWLKRCSFSIRKVDYKDVNYAKMLAKSVFGNKIQAVYHKTYHRKGGDTIELKWKGDVDADRFSAVVSSVFTAEKGYQLEPSMLVSLKSSKLMQKKLKKITGIDIMNIRAKYLKTLYDPNIPSTEVILHLMRYSKNAGYCSRYGRAVLNRVSKNGFIRPFWNQLGSEKNEVVSGRTSAKDPPIMQMASRAMLYNYDGDPGVSASKLLRSAYIAEPGCILIDADYSQIEPRITAEITGDKLLRKIFRLGIDLYDVTAQIIFGDQYVPPVNKPKDEMTKKEKKQADKAKHQRDFSKLVRLGTTYGMGYKSLYRTILDEMPKWTVIDEIDNEPRFGTEDDVKDILDKLNDSHPGVVNFIRQTEKAATRKLRKAGSLAAFRAAKNKGERKPFGVVYSMFKRHRRFCILPDHENDEKFDEEELEFEYNPTSENYYYNEFKRRCSKVKLAGFNHIIQATSADILKFAELYVYRELQRRIKEEGWDARLNRVLLTLHDELLVQVQEQHKEVAMKFIEELMLKAARKFLKVVEPEVNLGAGRNWFSAGNVEKTKRQAKLMRLKLA